MTVEVHLATADRFADVEAVLAPKKVDAPVCWCLSYRLPNAEYRQLQGPARPERLRRLCEQDPPPGVLAYVDAIPAGWCSFGPRTSMNRLVNSRTIPRMDNLPVWSVICFVVRTGYRRQGLTHHLLEGAISYARSRDVPALEAYPIDPSSGRVSPTLAYVGTTSLFEAAGFERVTATSAKSGGAARWLMRLTL